MISLNQQAPEKPDYREDGSLEVFRVWKTIQGEGPLSGRPAVFVRLSGCNLQCPACDTDYTSRRLATHPLTLLKTIREVGRESGPKLVVFTGGEPFRQNISPVVRDLFYLGYEVQIETNGTLYLEDFPWASPSLTVVCSPKTPVINRSLERNVTSFKYVLEAGFVDEDGLPSITLGGMKPARPPVWMRHDLIYVQPMDPGTLNEGWDEKYKENIKATVESALKHGFRISLQTHKILGVE